MLDHQQRHPGEVIRRRGRPAGPGPSEGSSTWPCVAKECRMDGGQVIQVPVRTVEPGRTARDRGRSAGRAATDITSAREGVGAGCSGRQPAVELQTGDARHVAQRRRRSMRDQFRPVAGSVGSRPPPFAVTTTGLIRAVNTPSTTVRCSTSGSSQSDLQLRAPIPVQSMSGLDSNTATDRIGGAAVRDISRPAPDPGDRRRTSRPTLFARHVKLTPAGRLLPAARWGATPRKRDVPRH